MALRIEAIDVAGPDGRARRLVFADGRQTRQTSAAAVRQLGLKAGDEVNDVEFDEQLHLAELELAKERSLRLLGFRERSAAELTRRLADDGYPEPVRRATVARLSELALVDDERFAFAYARSRGAAGYGPRKVRNELRRRGISEDTAHQAVSEAFSERDELEHSRMALKGRTAADRKDRDRLVRRLVSKGFSLSAARAAVDAVSSAGEDGEPFVV